MVQVSVEYIAVGGNRYGAAADWDKQCGLVAYGAGNNIALWSPQNNECRGVEILLTGHSNKVNAVKFFPQPEGKPRILVSGSVDKTIRIWKESPGLYSGFETRCVLEGNNGPINCFAVDASSGIFASGDADGKVKVWSVNVVEGGARAALVQLIDLKPRLFPLSIALCRLDFSSALLLAIGGTSNTIQLFASEKNGARVHFQHKAGLTGHEGWIRCLDFVGEPSSVSSDVLLASSSQDKYIRIWRIRQGDELPSSKPSHDTVGGAFSRQISNKAHRFELCGFKYSLTFEALLLGHEDWIYTGYWNNHLGELQLLSASADNSLAIWEADAASGIWVCVARVGELNAQKGSTTATGSAGGFWTGLWSPCGCSFIGLGRTGSWRRWLLNKTRDEWTQVLGVSGHTKEVRAISWARNSGFLLSTSSDQTTRLHALWRRESGTSWHEFSRAQIHGYNLNCIDTVGDTQFVSGADEKLLRVFDEPRIIAELLQNMCGASKVEMEALPEVASIPVLGLSNKAIDAADENGQNVSDGAVEPVEAEAPRTYDKSALDMDRPPTEDVLARHTLWPEKEKLYGHGFEISALAASHDGGIIATACKASSLEHAAVRLYETRQWREIKPGLTAHTLTVTCLRFTEDDTYLLSVGRDRRWTVFKQFSAKKAMFETHLTNPKSHSRMVLGAAWAPGTINRIFATAGRDKMVKLWALKTDDYEESASIAFTAAISAIDILTSVSEYHLVLAAGLETGEISLHSVNRFDFSVIKLHEIRTNLCPSSAITQLAWYRKMTDDVNSKDDGTSALLGVSSEDNSVRILATSNIDILNS